MLQPRDSERCGVGGVIFNMDGSYVVMPHCKVREGVWGWAVLLQLSPCLSASKELGGLAAGGGGRRCPEEGSFLWPPGPLAPPGLQLRGAGPCAWAEPPKLEPCEPKLSSFCPVRLYQGMGAAAC